MDYGINGSISVDAARPIEIESTTPIAVVGDSESGVVGLHFYGSATLALAHVAGDTDGVLRIALELIEKQGGKLSYHTGGSGYWSRCQGQILSL